MLASTAWGQEEDRKCSREAGFDHHLTKPAAPQWILAGTSGKRRKEDGPMQQIHLRFGQGFRVVLGNGCSNAPQMTFAPGETEGRTRDCTLSRLCACPTRETAENRPRGAVLYRIRLTELGPSICSAKRVARLNPGQAR